MSDRIERCPLPELGALLAVLDAICLIVGGTDDRRVSDRHCAALLDLVMIDYRAFMTAVDRHGR